ncbi:MAG: class I SAM-dependent methyltransferase [Candidatus Moduliflexus flocculans]|nr:class I SAM-dependent methyltransferase [Candidatus Moduliflexus flocculans]
MAAYARSTFGLDVREGTVETARPPERAFDAVVATHLIEHLNDPRSFLREVRRAMRPDGRLYLVTPNADGLQALADELRMEERDPGPPLPVLCQDAAGDARLRRLRCRVPRHLGALARGHATRYP